MCLQMYVTYVSNSSCVLLLQNRQGVWPAEMVAWSMLCQVCYSRIVLYKLEVERAGHITLYINLHVVSSKIPPTIDWGFVK